MQIYHYVYDFAGSVQTSDQLLNPVMSVVTALSLYNEMQNENESIVVHNSRVLHTHSVHLLLG